MRASPGDRGCGLIAAIADGVSGAARGGGRGREAAQTTVLGLLADSFATPPAWETTVALDRLIGAQDAWLVSQSRQREGLARPAREGLAERPGEEVIAALTTLTVLGLQGRSGTLAHVGDTRLWRLAGDSEMVAGLTQIARARKVSCSRAGGSFATIHITAMGPQQHAHRDHLVEGVHEEEAVGEHPDREAEVEVKEGGQQREPVAGSEEALGVRHRRCRSG
ncbi:MAG TPA: hypothetical protein VFR90_12215 [Methylibium sp.]|uniref:hypothetical protein n=1 Tax=Methylibium sp. TaxID=2067992 RepID=UPI002DBFA891|nr:hypothetical protein [Methylibium sp.]HEU4459880.1 hypothetical protein [Methylibium sp.]